ncbi:MAG: DUF3151 domain-containing protein [Actinomycetota bacterium]
MDLPVGEPLETEIEEPGDSLAELAAAGQDVARIKAVAAKYPRCLAAWAALGEPLLHAGHAVDAYAYFRVGYHRGLDTIRKAGWKGSGRVPWVHEGNRGFLRCLRGLEEAAAAINEQDEAERCAQFFVQLAPDAP